jgi:putative ABC transport system permease protein
MRTTLTLLGIVFGVAAVITMIGVGEGAQRTVLREISALGLQNIILDSVQPGNSSDSTKKSGRSILSYGLTKKDVAQIKASCGNASFSVAHLVKQKVFVGSKRIDAKTFGVAPNYFDLFDTKLERGRFISVIDNIQSKPVAVISSSVAEAIRATGQHLPTSIRIGKKYIDVIGIIEIRGRQGDLFIMLPYNTAKNTFGSTTIKREAGNIEFTRNEIGQIVIRVNDENSIPQTTKIVRRIINTNHKQSDVEISVPLDILHSKQQTQRIFNMVLLCIAGISLLVGGIGVMNIMLAIVTERIQEIGLRRAVGARRIDILLQFLTETVVLCTLGGIIGCALGIIAIIVAAHLTGWPVIITIPAILLSLGVSWSVGLLFGITPAIRAAKMDPVTALRYE